VDVAKVLGLLDQWDQLIEAGELASKLKAGKVKDGLNGRIHRTTGMPVVFDFETYNDQKNLQNELCQELPQFANLIRSIPEIMDGYAWARRDFIELYFSHYQLVIQKIRKLIN
jgi:hypothetical protein